MTDSNNSGGMDEVLKPCPFCGASVVLQSHPTDSSMKTVWCDTCDCGTALNDRAEDAIESWNRRTPAPDEQVGTLVKAAEHLLDDGWMCHPDNLPCGPELKKALAPFQRENGNKNT